MTYVKIIISWTPQAHAKVVLATRMEQMLAWHPLVLVFATSNILETLAMTVLPITTEIQSPILAQFALLAGFTSKNLVTLYMEKSYHLLKLKPNANL